MTEEFSRQALSKAAKYCAYKERAPLEVIQKLKKWGLDELSIQQVISELSKENYLDESRFAKAFCHDKFEFNKWGKMKIRRAIARYQLDDEIVEEALSYISDKKYQEVLVDLAEMKKTSTKEEDPYILKQKVAAYLVGKGFEMDLVFSVLHKMSFS